MSLIQLTQVSKSYDFKPVLKGVDLTLNEGERVGLLGCNGAGKTTLLRILAGLEPPDAGERAAKKDLKLGYLEQAPPLDAASTVREAVQGGLTGRAEVLAALEQLHAQFEQHDLGEAKLESLMRRQSELETRLDALGGHDVDHRVDELVRHLGLRDAEAPCGVLSGGERRRVALARLLIAEPDLLLLDEPTNHLDALVIDWLEDLLIESRVPLLLVTHDRYFLDRVVDRIVELEHGRLTSCDGNYTFYLWQKGERDAAAEQAESGRRNLLRRETAWARRGPPARTRKSKARMQRYEQLLGDVPDPPLSSMELALPPGPRLGEKVVRFHAVEKSYDGRCVVPALEFEIGPGERLGIVGPNGAGKTTILKLCLGEVAPDAGRVVVGETVKFAAIDQARSSLDPEKTVLEEVAAQEGGVVKVGDGLVRVESFLDRFLFPGPAKRLPVKLLSGGERNRVLLAKLMIQAGNVVLLDEPTNDLDLATLRALEEALIAFQGSVVVVSHDRWFLDRVATRILHLDGKGGARLHVGALSSLLERFADERAEAERTESQRAAAERARAARRAVKPAAPSAKAPAKRKRGFLEQQELDALPDRIAGAEAEAAELDARFADAAFYSGPRAEVESARARRAELAAQIERFYARWAELD
jgi:ATP-binding cassette subfamily F protein uup